RPLPNCIERSSVHSPSVVGKAAGIRDRSFSDRGLAIGKQIDAIVRMLNLNSPVTVTVGGGLASDGDVYKVLLLDKYSRDLISPLLKVSDLRKHGITLHLMVDADRQPIPDVPAVYFLQPTAGNMQRLVLDATRGTYDKMHLNFTSSVPRLLLEDLAAGTLKANALHRVARVFDQYLEFVCLDHGLFSLGQPESYVRLNDPMAKDKDVEGAVESIVNGLFCVLVTLGVVPVIRCPERGPAEMVARQLDAKLRAHLATHNNLFKEAAAGALAAGAAAVASGGGGAGVGAGGGGALGLFQRPLLFIADRNFELAVGVQHEWTYRPLVHDVLGMRLNRVSIHKGGAAGGAGAGSGPLSPVLKGAGGGGGAKATSYELDDSDSFWVAHSESPFPKAAEAVDMLLKKWTQDKEQVNAASPTGDAFSEAEDEDVMGRTKQLSAAMSAVPQLMERKRVIDKHVTIGGTLLEEIKSRALDAYFSMEEDLLTRGSTDRAAMLDLLRKRGSKEDKLRLAIIYLMVTDNASAGDVEAVEAALREQQVDLAALHYIKQVKRVNSSFAAVAAAGGGAGGVGGVGGSKDDLLDWAGRLAGQGLSRVTAGVKNLLAGGRQLQLTRAVEALMEGRPGQDTDSFLCLDPKAPKGGSSSTAAGGSRGAVRDAIVFVIGGGNYMEYGGLQEMARKAGAGGGAAGVRTVVYGTTEMLAGSQFVEQLSELGRKMGYKAPPPPAESVGGAFRPARCTFLPCPTGSFCTAHYAIALLPCPAQCAVALPCPNPSAVALSSAPACPLPRTLLALTARSPHAARTLPALPTRSPHCLRAALCRPRPHAHCLRTAGPSFAALRAALRVCLPCPAPPTCALPEPPAHCPARSLPCPALLGRQLAPCPAAGAAACCCCQPAALPALQPPSRAALLSRIAEPPLLPHLLLLLLLLLLPLLPLLPPLPLLLSLLLLLLWRLPLCSPLTPRSTRSIL
ncbi:unnamed protein product, partial [Closterium sp. NIES-54]